MRALLPFYLKVDKVMDQYEFKWNISILININHLEEVEHEKL